MQWLVGAISSAALRRFTICNEASPEFSLVRTRLKRRSPSSFRTVYVSAISLLPNTEVVSQVPIAEYAKRNSTRFGATVQRTPAAVATEAYPEPARCIQRWLHAALVLPEKATTPKSFRVIPISRNELPSVNEGTSSQILCATSTTNIRLSRVCLRCMTFRGYVLPDQGCPGCCRTGAACRMLGWHSSLRGASWSASSSTPASSGPPQNR